MRAQIAGLLTLLLTSGCATAPKDDFDPFALEIEAGRWGVMNSQGLAIVETLPPSAHMLDESDPARRAGVDRQLREAVRELARLKSWACGDEKLSHASCAAEFAPGWALKAEAEPPSWMDLQKRSDAVGAAVMPVWNELCAAAQAHRPKQYEDADYPCPME